MNAQSRPFLGNSGEWILDTIKRNPEGLLLLAAGAVLMMRTSAAQPRAAGRSDREGVRRTAQRAADTVSDTARKAWDSTSSYASSASDTARQTMDAAKSYASSASDAAQQTMDTARSYASSAADYADQARRTVGQQSERVVKQTRSMAQGVVQNQPFAIILAGLAAGVALAAAFPPTQLEKDTLGPMADEMSKATKRIGDELSQATMKAGEKLKTVAEERGLNPEGLKDVANEGVDTFKASIRGQPEEPAPASAAGQYGTGDRSQ
jgi:hypothetical protein